MALKPTWYRSLSVQINAALIMLFSLAAGTVGFTLYELDLRKHDYVIMNLVGQLRVIAKQLVSQSLYYREHSKASTLSSNENDQLFIEGLSQGINDYEAIISALQARSLPPELTGRTDPLRCNWDAQARAQLDATAKAWQLYKKGLEKFTAADMPASELMSSTDYILGNEPELAMISRDLANAFQSMMEGKLAAITWVNRLLLATILVVTAVLTGLLFKTFIHPLKATLSGIGRVTQGEFGHQIPVTHNNEIGQVADAFNALSCRLDALFRLTDKITQATTLDETLRFVYEEFRAILTLDWLGLVRLNEAGDRFVLEHVFTDLRTQLVVGASFNANNSLLQKALDDGAPLHIPSLVETAIVNPDAEFAARLHEDGRRSALFFPLGDHYPKDTVLIFAASQGHAYNAEHLELLTNIATQVTHGFEKTVVTENLVISAITGLAKLAENRDPETGDHLIRMARYSALIAEELGKEGPYQEQINADYVRDIHRFAPMHDIGKVGIEDSILLKPGKLTAEERREMERHPLIGAEVLRHCEEQMQRVGHSVFKLGIEIAESHHEKYDGSGYPHGKAGNDIPLSARIVATADVFDALTSKRPYKEAWPIEKALAVMDEEAGRHFDPEIVSALHRAMTNIMAVYEDLKHV